MIIYNQTNYRQKKSSGNILFNLFVLIFNIFLLSIVYRYRWKFYLLSSSKCLMNDFLPTELINELWFTLSMELQEISSSLLASKWPTLLLSAQLTDYRRILLPDGYTFSYFIRRSLMIVSNLSALSMMEDLMFYLLSMDLDFAFFKSKTLLSCLTAVIVFTYDSNFDWEPDCVSSFSLFFLSFENSSLILFFISPLLVF
jgi:hypothetical protein